MRSITLKGGPRQVGLAHGESFKREIRELASLRRELLQKYLVRMKPLEIEELALSQVHTLSKHPDLFDEFCGIARASAVGLVDLMVLNNYTDLRDFGHGEEEGGCTLFYLRNQERAIAGQTWDMHASATPYTLHIQLEAHETRPAQHLLTVTGCLGLAGVNTHGVGVLINNLYTHETGSGLAWNALVRKILLAPNARQGRTTLEANLPCSGHNYLIYDRSSAYNIEATGRELECTSEVTCEGLTFHTNHYVGRLKSSEITKLRSKTTDARYAATERYFSGLDLKNVALSQLGPELLGGTKAPAVCVRPVEGDPHSAMTCGGLIFDLEARKGIAFQGLYGDGDHLEIKI